jgi:RNA polymerase sigma-70 factor, ECF subfamily
VADHRQDLLLVRALASGDEQAFTRFFDEYAPRLYRFTLRRLRGNEDAAEELTQRTLSRAVEKLNSYRGEASLFTWLCQICWHLISDYVRDHQRDAQRYISVDDDPGLRAVLESIPIETSTEPPAIAEKSDEARLVQIVLDQLPGSYADALEWKYIEGLEVAEIASRMRVTPLAAQSLLARARVAFRNAWINVAGETLDDSSIFEGTS